MTAPTNNNNQTCISKTIGIAAGAAQLAAGTLCLLTKDRPVVHIVGIVFLGSGTESGVSALTSKRSRIPLVDYLGKVKIGALKGAVSAAVGTLNFGARVVLNVLSPSMQISCGNVAAAAIDSALINGAGTALNAKLNDGSVNARNMASAALGGAVGAAVSQSMSVIPFLKPGNIVENPLSAALHQGAKAGAGGFVSTGASRAIENLCQGIDWNHKLKDSALAGMCSSGLTGCVQGFLDSREFGERIKASSIDRGNRHETLSKQRQLLECKIQKAEEELKKWGALRKNLNSETTLRNVQNRQEARLNHNLDRDRQELANCMRDLQELPKWGMPLGNPSMYLELGSVLVPTVSTTSWVIEGRAEWEELIQHVVLVHALKNLTSEGGRIQRLTPEGVLGPHIDLKQVQFRDNFATRPHIHWAWNQLVPPHSVASWEDDQIAILDPLSAFEQDGGVHEQARQPVPWGVAPYDTMTIGSHRLSDQAKILVPETLLEETRKYLNPKIHDKIITFNPQVANLRTAVFNALNAHFPYVWHVCNEEGELIGAKAHRTVSGYERVSSLKKTNGEMLILIRGEGFAPEEQVGPMKTYSQNKRRFIGLHNNSVTMLLDVNYADPYFDNLRIFSTERREMQLHPTKKHEAPLDCEAAMFPSYSGHDINSLRELGIFKVFDICQCLFTEQDPHTGVHELANYFLSEAICYDLASLFYQKHPGQNFSFSPDDLRSAISAYQESLVAILGSIRKYREAIPPQSGRAKELHAWRFPPNQQQTVMQLFKQYQTGLKDCLATLRNEENVRKWLMSQGLEAEDFTQKLGDCLFDNIAAQIAPNHVLQQLRKRDPEQIKQLKVKSFQLRENLVHYMREHAGKYSPYFSKLEENRLQIGSGFESLQFDSWETYLEMIKTPGVWATELEVRALADLLERPVVILTHGQAPKTYLETSKARPLILRHVNGNHFESCTPFKSESFDSDERKMA